MKTAPALPAAAAAGPLSPAADATLAGLQRAAFGDFVRHGNRGNGLVADTSCPGSHASIAVVGFALSAHAVGVECGWMTRAEALPRCTGRTWMCGRRARRAFPSRPTPSQCTVWCGPSPIAKEEVFVKIHVREGSDRILGATIVGGRPGAVPMTDKEQP